jgi:hypothetical protein
MENSRTQATAAIKESNEYLHKTYGDWVNAELVQGGFKTTVILEHVDIEATLEKMDADPNIPKNENPMIDMLTKLRDSLADGTYVPKIK